MWIDRVICYPMNILSMPEGGTLTVKEVASFLRVHQNTVYALIEDGSLKASKVRRQYRIKKEDLMDYLNR